MNHRPLALFLVLSCVLAATARADYVLGDYYATSGDLGSQTVTHFSQIGAILGTFQVASAATAGGLKGVAYDPSNGLLYSGSSNANGNLTVVAFNSSGVIQQTYTTASPTGGNISFEKITFDNSGNFYVGDGAGVHKFTVGVFNSGGVISNGTTNGAYDIKNGPNGDLIVAGDYDIKEITAAGAVVKNFKPAAGSPFLINVRGLAYDAGSNSLYVSMLGYTGETFQVEKFNYSTGALLASTTFTYADSLFLTSGGNLLVGSRTQAPALFDSNLNVIEQFAGAEQLFVTQAVPEPASLALLALGSTLTIVARRVVTTRKGRAGSPA